MCWSANVTYAMVGLGAAAAVVTWRRGDPAAIWGTLGYFAAMEGLQAWGYAVVDQCGTTSNSAATLLSYIHIAFQPIVINVFCMALVGPAIDPATRRRVLALASLATVLLLARLIPASWAGTCPPGTPLCGAQVCTITGTWHIGWTLPLNDLYGQIPPLRWLYENVPPLVSSGRFPDYILAAFVMPCFYGAWRFALFHALFGPILALVLTPDLNEMPAVWCLLSIGLILIGLSPAFRRQLVPRPATG